MPIERRIITSINEWLAWRRNDVTASVVGALFGVHEYKTIFELWNDVTGTTPPRAENKLMRRGRKWERTVADVVMEEHPDWKLRKANVYLRDPRLRLGATPDYFLTLPNGQRGVLQIKVINPMSFRRRWSETTAPQWIVLQTLVEMMLSKATFGVIAAMEVDGYNDDVHYYDVPRHAAAERRIRETVAAFWRTVESGAIPKPDYNRDGALLAAMHPHAKPGAVIDLRHDNRMPQILDERAKLKAELDAKKAALAALDTEIKQKLGENEIALVNGWTVKCKEIQVAAYEKKVEAYSYRKLDCTREEAAPEPEPAEPTKDAAA
jgi:predicted phage-related endonuclease